ncbi:MAG: TrkA family potassium uptake protein [Lachnospiraceae bacterium]|nr:TrkA family potassium uptake protein [Lachnospiraceae bacterium]
MKSFAVIGLGLFGTQLAVDLFNEGNNVLAIDSAENNIERIADHVSKAVTLDAKNRESLAQLGINKYDCVIVCTSTDLATSVIITMNLRALNVPKIICKVQNDTDKEVLEALGASTCIIPEHVAALKLSKQLISNNVVDFTQLSEDYSIMEIIVPSVWTGKSIIDLNVRSQYGLNIIGIRHNDKLEVDFQPTYELQSNDELIIVGSNKNLSKIQKLR